jgi:FAD/FMN-containing dehydrogenase
VPATPRTCERWRNWAGNHRAEVEVLRPGSVDEVAALLARATAEGRRVRPVGSGHSFSGVAAPVDLHLSLELLTGVRSVGSDGLVEVWAGTPLHRLTAELARRGCSLTNLGDIDRQTLAGAIATGTHGTGARFGGLATQVRALELVAPDGEVLRCSPTQHPDVFAAARVGLGALGVVTAVTVQAEPAFALRAEEGPGTLTAALDDFDGLMTSTDHVDLYWFPHTDATLVKRNSRVPLDEGLAPLSRWR